MVRARAPALYGSVDKHFMDPGSLQRLVRRQTRDRGLHHQRTVVTENYLLSSEEVLETQAV